MKQIKNITAAEILKQIKLTVICGEEITETNVCDGFSTWFTQFDASNPYEAFTPAAREYFQNKLFVAFAAGMLPAEVTETRTNEVGPDGCWVFTVETTGTLNPFEETEETETEETTAPAEEQTTETENAPQAATQAAEGTAQQADELDKLRNLRDALKTAPTPDTIRTALDAIRQHDPETELTEDDSPRAIKSELQHIINGIGLDAYMEQARAQRAPWPAVTDTDTEEEEEEETMYNTFTPAEAAMHAATVRGIIRRQGGYRERDIIAHPHTVERGETWNAEHKVVNIISTTPDPDGYRPGCAVDIVTRAIVG